jgi:hypothetical protein
LATIAYAPPQVQIEAYNTPPGPRKAPAGTGHTGTAVILPGDFVTIAAGVLTRAATGTNANVFGIANMGEQQIWGPYGGNSAVNVQGVFGTTQALAGGPLIPEDSIDVAVYPLVGNQIFEMSLSNVTGWQSGGTYQANYGTTGGFLLDTTTNLFVFDPSQANKPLTIFAKAIGPNILLPSGVVIGKGTVGDLGARVICFMNSAAV